MRVSASRSHSLFLHLLTPPAQALAKAGQGSLRGAIIDKGEKCMRFKYSYLLYAVVLLALSMSLGICVFAQNATGSITGVITDPNNAVIPNAAVTVTNRATGAVRKVVTKEEGNYTVENLVPGQYEVKIEAKGFSTMLQIVSVEVGSTATGNFAMTVGQSSELITVSGESSSLVNTTDTVVGGIVNRDKVENLPLNGRSFLSVALLEPGVSVNYQAASTAGAPNNYFQVSVGSAPQSMTLISVDGSRVNDRVTGGTSQNFSSETVQEFQISTLAFDLSSGTVSSGAINIVSRTGTNKFHGSTFFFFRDHNMSAFQSLRRPTEIQTNGRPLSPFCADPNSAACKSVVDPFFVRKQYGGSLGGPIKKDKFFFFANYERTDQLGALPITYTEPALVPFNHVGKQPFKQHLANARLDYTLSQKHTAFLRTSFDVNSNISGGSTLESLWIASSNFSYQTQLGVTSVLKPTLVNDLRFSYSYFRNFLAPPSQAECELISSGTPGSCYGLNGVRVSVNGAFLFGNSVNVPQDRHPRTYQLTDNFNWTHGSHRVRFGGSYEYSNGHGTWNQNYQGTFNLFSPTQVQAANPTLFNALPASLRTGVGVTIADVLQLPMQGTLSIGIGDPTQPAPYRQDEILGNHFLRFYGQDAWQVRPGFTLNYGLGWSFESNILYHDLDLPAYLTPIVGADKIGKTIPQRLKNFDPAFGFAYAVGKDQKTVIRSSISLHHISPNVDFYKINQRILFGPAGNGLGSFSAAGLANPKPGTTGALSFTAPTAFTGQDMLTYLGGIKNQLNTLYNNFNGKDLALRGINLTKTVQGPQGLDAVYDLDSSRFPYTIHLDVGVQRELRRNLSVTVDYVMRRGVGFGTGFSGFDQFYPDRNLWNKFAGYTISATGAAVPGARTPVIPACTTAQSATLFTNPVGYANTNCSTGPILYGLPGILSRYSALQVKLDKRFSQGFSLTGAYSLVRYTTIASISNNNNLYEGFGPSGAQPRHRMSASAIWELPKYKGEMRLLRGLVNGWQASTIMQMQSGTPTSVTLPGTLDVDGDGTFTYRLPGTTVSSFGYNLGAADIRDLVTKYNASIPAAANVALRDIAAGAQRDAIGTALPNIILPDKFSNSDSFLTHDLRLSRNILITEKVKLQLIGEGFNIFNVSNLNGYSGSLNAYGRPATTGGTPTLPTGTPINTAGLDCSGPRAAFVCGLTFGQPTGRVSAVFGSGGPRAFQLAARLSF